MKKHKFLIKAIGLMIAVMLMGAGNAFAATTTWIGVTSTAWATGTNWSGGIEPAIGDDVIIELAGAFAPEITVSTNALASLTINAAAGPTTLTITGGAVLCTIQDPGTVTSAATSAANTATITGTGILDCDIVTVTNSATGGGLLTIDCARFDVGAAKTITFNGVENITVDSVIGFGATTALVVVDMTELADVVTLSGVNLYSGTTTITTGTLSITDNASLGAVNTTAIGGANAKLMFSNAITTTEVLTVAGGTIESLSGVNSCDGTVTASAPSTITSTAGGVLFTLGGVLDGDDFTFTGAGNTICEAAINNTGTPSVTKTGAGTLTLSVASLYEGTTTISEGIVLCAHANSLGTIDNGTIVATGATLQLKGTITTLVEPLTLSGTLDNLINDNSFSGPITLGAASTITATAGAFTIGSTIDGDTFLPKFTGGGTIVLNGIVSGSAGVALEMTALANTVTFSAVNDYTGTTLITSGKLITDAVTQIPDTSPVNIAGAAAIAGLTLGASETIGSLSGTGNIVDGGANTLTVTQTTDATYSGIFGGGAGLLIKEGTGILTLSGVNTYTGLTTVNAGTLRYGIDAALSTGAVTVNGGTLDLVTFDESVGTVTLTSGTIAGTTGVLTTTTTFELTSGTVSAILAGAVPLNKVGVGVVTLSGANTFTGACDVKQGELVLANVTAFGTGAKVITMSAGAIDAILTIGAPINAAAWVPTITLAEDATIKSTVAGLGSVIDENISVIDKILTITGDESLEISGVIGNTAGGLEIDMTDITDVVTLSGANLYDGVTTVTSGDLVLNNAATLDPTLGDVTMVNSATAKLTIATTQDIGTLKTGGPLGGNIDITGTLTVNQGANETYAGIISGGALTLDGAGFTLTLTGASTYTGLLTITDGTLNIQNATATGTTAAGTVLNAGTLQLENNIVVGNETLKLSSAGGTELVNISGDNSWEGAITLTANAQINTTAGTLTLGVGGISGAFNLEFATTTDLTVNGVIGTGVGTVAKTGTGALTLNGENTYTGATTVTVGTINFNGASTGASPVTASGSAKVAGTGTIPGPLSMTVTSILAPGASNGDAVGTLTINGLISFTDTECKYVVTVTGGAADKIVGGGANIALAGTPPSANIEIQANFDVSQLTVPVTIIDLSAGGTYAQKFDDALLILDEFTIDQVLTAGGLITILSKPTTQVTIVATVMTVTPTQLPKGAYVNGPGGFDDDNYYWQTLEITFPVAGVNEYITIDLPDFVYVADTDDDANVEEEVALATDSTVPFTVDGVSPTTISIVQSAPVVADKKLWIMFPVITDLNPGTANQDDYSLTFSLTTGQNIAHGEDGAPAVTLRDAGALQLVDFADNLSGDNDLTSDLGRFYPDTAVNTHDALPDLVEDIIADFVPSIVLATLPGVDGDDTDDITYTFWVSTDSTLSHISVFQEGVSHAENYETPGDYEENELGTGNARHYTGGLSEGDYYIYITSDFTGDFPLARSGKLTVKHYPVISLIGWDLTGNGYDNTGFYTDDADMTLDTGGLYMYDGTIPATSNSTAEADIYVGVDDLDDNADVTLFYSTDTGLTEDLIETSGTSPDILVTGLTGANILTDALYENVEDSDGFSKFTWIVDPEDDDAFVPPVAPSYVPAGSYTIYAVANDGKHQHFLKAQGNEVPVDDETIDVRHSPNLNIDVLTEYDLGTPSGNADVTIAPSQSDVIMISWGKDGVSGDSDPDDSCTIEFYIDYDTLQNDQADYSAEDYTALRTAASGTESATGTHKINVDDLDEDSESKGDSYYAWSLKEDFNRTGWLPTHQAIYHLYAIIDENKVGGTVRVIALGSDGIVDIGEAITEIEFDNATTFARLIDPPAKGMSLNGDETVNLRFNAFDYDADGDVGIFLLEYTEEISGDAGPATVLISNLEAAALATPGSAICLTDDDGYHDGGTRAWLSEDDDTSFALTIRTPGDVTLRYSNDMAVADPAATNINGTYWVYIGVDPDNDDFADGTETLTRAPGTLTIVNSNIAAPQRNLALSPTKAIVAQGDTISYSINSVDPGGTAVLMDVFVAVEKQFFYLVPFDTTTPFTDPTGYGTLIENSIIDDDANGRWILHATVFNSGNAITTASTGLGTEVASFQLVSKGTSDPVEETTAVSYVNEPGNGWVTGYTYDGETSTTVVNTFSSDVRIQPRAIVEGIVEFEGRDDMALTVTFELRERDSYVTSDDADFIDQPDVDLVTDGLQYTLDSDGKFTLMKVPSGEWDLVVIYDRYLSAMRAIEVYPGVDDVFKDFDMLLGGDCAGYTDETGASYPDNEVDTEDLDQISDAYLDETGSERWDDGVFNYKWCDIDESGKVEVNDLQLATANSGESGAQPVYKPAVQPGESNFSSTFELFNLPDRLTAGQTYTIQATALNTTNVRGYFVNLSYNKDALSFAGVTKGDYISDYSYYFPTPGDGTIGFTNAVYGNSIFSGDGVLAEFSFTALRDGVFNADLIGIMEATVVNSDFMKETVVMENLTHISGNDAPEVFALTQNYPNPFNPTTTIDFSITESGNVTLKIYDILGRNMRTLVDGNYSAGSYSILWDATDMNGNMVSTGIYFYAIKAENFSQTKRMLFMK